MGCLLSSLTINAVMAQSAAEPAKNNVTEQQPVKQVLSGQPTQVFEYQTTVVQLPESDSNSEKGSELNEPSHHHTDNHHEGSESSQPFRKQYWRVQKNDHLILKERPNTTELWYKAKDGIHLIKMLNAVQMAIEYYPADFTSMNKPVDWQKLITIFPKSLLKQTVETNTPYWQYTTSTYRLTVNESEFTVKWIEQLDMPAHIIERSNGTVIETTLLNYFVGQPIHIDEWLDQHVKKSYEYSDIGDNESDPILRSLMKSGIYYGEHDH